MFSACSGFTDEAKQAPATQALKRVGPTLAKVYTFEPFHPAMADHLWKDAGNGRAVCLHFNKPVAEPSAKLIFVGKGIRA